ncbi:endonuclease [Crocosphaera chwakensis]|nr:endonuclease [Crocosphaera chwakensis]
MTTDFLPVVLVLVFGWLLAATLGTWAYFANENKAEN